MLEDKGHSYDTIVFPFFDIIHKKNELTFSERKFIGIVIGYHKIRQNNTSCFILSGFSRRNTKTIIKWIAGTQATERHQAKSKHAS